MASMGSIGEFPDIVRDVYVTKAKNDVGAIMIRFFIRGKPWVVSVDNSKLPCTNGPPREPSQSEAFWSAAKIFSLP